MNLKVVVWGSGNVGKPAIRAVLSHAKLDLAAVIVADPDKDGRDAGELVGMDRVGIAATRNWRAVIDSKPDVVVYTATADIRPQEAMTDLLACLEAGIDVVSSAFYSYLHPASTAEEVLKPVRQACERGGASLLVSGIDPGWVMDMLPVTLSGAVSGIQEIRTREIFNYALYDQPHVVREVIGFGGSMDELPLMLHDFAIEMVWAPMVRIIGDALGKPVEEVAIEVERLPLEKTINVPGMGEFKAGTQGAFRFELQGLHGGKPLYILEHITRIDDACAPHWDYPPEGGGCHQVIIKGNPDLHVSVHAKDHFSSGEGGGGNASAANWLVNAIPGVHQGKPGVLTIMDIPRFSGADQIAE
jgi:hypothetical protein